MIVPYITDIDRLHEAVELILSDKYRGRREGKTFAYITLMTHEIELGDYDNTYVYIGENAQHAMDVMKEFIAHAKHTYGDGVVFEEILRNRVVVNGRRFMFMSATSCLDCRIRGVSIHRIFFDVSTEKQQQLDRTGAFDEIAHLLYPALALHNGDII